MATVSIPAMQHNLQHVASRVQAHAREAKRPSPFIWAVIKANAYGHGIDQALAGFGAADGLAMLDLAEAIRCRNAGWRGPLLLLEGFFEPADIDVVDTHGLTVSIHSEGQLQMLERATPLRPISVNLKINTGMNRLGFPPSAAAAVWRRLQALKDKQVVGEIGTMMHFSRADDDPEVTRHQLSTFLETVAGMDGPISVCNSAATLTPEVWMGVPSNRNQWLRPGICLYGASPFADRSAADLGLRAVMTLSSKIIAVQECRPGDSVGYGHMFTAETVTRVGIVACGYADGYPRHAGTGTPVSVNGRRTILLGRVSMDMLAVDLTPVPGSGVGSNVVLWGEGGPSVDDVAQAAGTVGYELLCAVAPRVPRQILHGLNHNPDVAREAE